MFRIAMIDDDKNMFSAIRQIITDIGEDLQMEICEFLRPEDVLEKLKQDAIFDVIISDIEMEGMIGLEFGEIVRRAYPDIYLVFLTAYPHYAVKSYEINAHQYILKDDMEARLPVVLGEVMRQAKRQSVRYRNVFKGNEIKKLAFRDIFYISKVKAEKYIEYTTIYGKYQERISLEKILEEINTMNNPQFIMIERGIIVNAEHIDCVKGRMIILENGETLMISRGRYAEVREKLHMCWRS